MAWCTEPIIPRDGARAGPHPAPCTGWLRLREARDPLLSHSYRHARPALGTGMHSGQRDMVPTLWRLEGPSSEPGPPEQRGQTPRDWAGPWPAHPVGQSLGWVGTISGSRKQWLL